MMRRCVRTGAGDFLDVLRYDEGPALEGCPGLRSTLKEGPASRAGAERYGCVLPRSVQYVEHVLSDGSGDLDLPNMVLHPYDVFG